MKGAMMNAVPLPESRQQLLVDDPLYTRYELGELDWGGLIRRALDNGALDVWCPECERLSVYRVESGYGRDELAQKLSVKTWFTVEARCTRDHRTLGTGGRCDGRLVVLFARDGKFACKAGIHPPKTTLDLAGLDAAVTGELDAALREDLGRAVSLRAHGVGAGSFVYLRRVLAGLLEQAHRRAAAAPGWNESRYQKTGGAERVRLLAAELPPRVAETAPLFAILDRGADQLTEAECHAHFDLLFQAITILLRERNDGRLYAEAVGRAVQGGGAIEG
jgi:hypothetical protein